MPEIESILVGVGLFVIAYCPLTYFAFRLSHLTGTPRYLFGLTAAPVFLAGTITNIVLCGAFFPRLFDWLQQFPKHPRGAILVAGLILLPIPIAATYIWYHTVRWLGRLSFDGRVDVQEEGSEW